MSQKQNTSYKKGLGLNFSKLAKFAALACLVLMFLLACVFSYNSHKNQVYYNKRLREQQKLFEDASAKCKQQPFVVVKDFTTLAGGETSFQLYGPLDTHYDDYKTRPKHSNDAGGIGYTEVYDYYCSLADAKAAVTTLNQSR